MFSKLVDFLNSSIAREVFLVIGPSAIIGFMVMPNYSLYLIEDETFSFNETEISTNSFYAASNTTEDCTSCHYDVAAEIQSTPHHHGFDCEVCHTGMNTNISCLDCHPVSNFHAHSGFIEWAEGNPEMYSSNEACIACHTSAEIEIYQQPVTTTFEVNADLRTLHS